MTFRSATELSPPPSRPPAFLVTATERVLLRQLSLFEQPFTIDELEARLVLPPGSPAALDVAQSFADRGLLTPTDGGLTLTPRLEAFDAATSELLLASDPSSALRRQLVAVLQLTGLEPTDLETFPALWSEARLERARATELAGLGPLSGWKLGELALLLPPSARAPVLDDVVFAFERITGTPIGPGNDDGPFCDVAHALSRSQAERALEVVRAMQLSGWGDEARTAEAALVARLDLEGLAHPPLAPDDEAYRQAARERFRSHRAATLSEWSDWARAALLERPWSITLEPFTYRLHALEATWALDTAREVLVRHA